MSIDVSSYNIINILSIPADVYILNKFLMVFFERDSIKNDKLLFCMYMARVLLANLVSVLFPYPIIYTPLSFLTLYLCCLCFDVKKTKRLVVTIFIFVSLCSAEAFVAVITGTRQFDLFRETKQGEAYELILLEVVEWLISVLLSRYQYVKSNRMPIPTPLIVAVIIVPGTTMTMLLWIFQRTEDNNLLAFISMVGVVAVNFVIIYLYDSMGKIFEEQVENELVKREKAYYYHQSQLLEKNYEDARKLRHDIKNKLIAIEQMVVRGEDEKAQEFFNSIKETVRDTKMYSDTGNTAIDSIINYKLSLAKEHGIHVTAKIFMPREMEIKTDDIVTILGNLLDNALEAVDKLTENKYITVNLEYDRGCVYIEVKNSFDGHVEVKNHELRTRKGDDKAHGIGLKSVEEAVENYQGSMEYQYTEDEFKISILLYVKL